MDWIKRNLFFVIGGVVALALLGGAGYYGFNRYQTYAAAKEKFNGKYDELKRLNDLKPSPGNDKVNNTENARVQEAEVRATFGKLGKFFQPIPAVVNMTSNAASGAITVSGEDYAAALRQVIDQLQKEAAAGSVLLPQKYKFSFEAQSSLIKFQAGSLVPLANQLAEIRVIAGILNKSKVNAIEAIRRERVSTDDNTGPVTDYIDRASTTNNEMAVMTPYELSFRCFSTELASVLTGFASSPYSIVVKGFNVEPGGASGGVDPATGMAYGVDGQMNPSPVPVYIPQPVPVHTRSR